MTNTMRRHRQALTPEACAAVLAQESHGVLALAADDFPYAVPLSYVYSDGVLYFHCAKAGHKLDLLRRDGRASFCVVAEDNVVPDAYTTYYRSVLCFGTLTEVEDDTEKRAAIVALGRKYAPHEPDTHLDEEIRRFGDALCILKLTPDHITGKEALELVQARAD